MEIDSVMDWLDGMENHFECKGVSGAQKVKVAKSRHRGSALTWWKYVEDKMISMGQFYFFWLSQLECHGYQIKGEISYLMILKSSFIREDMD